MQYKFNVGDKVVFVNDFGVCWGVKTVTALDERTNRPTYHYAESDTPWCSVGEENFILADAEDLTVDINENWNFFQKKYGWKPTVEQLGGCY
jgi:hypothetical protein